MPNYTKLFNSIVTSTIWTEDDKTRIVWITMLAISDQNGEVHASIPGLARIAGVSVADTETALGKFLSPDSYSRTPDNEGRRIAVIDGGWELLNHAKYRRMASKAEEKEANAARQRRFRARNATVTESNASVTVGNAQVTDQRDIAEADTETDTKTDLPPNPLKGESSTSANPRKRREQDDESELSPEGLAFADWFRSTLDPGAKPASKWREQWAKAFDDMIRLDNRTSDEIRRVSQWARSDSFWSGNFLSPLKLRKTNRDKVQYFDVFAAAMRKAKPTPPPVVHYRDKPTIIDANDPELIRRMEEAEANGEFEEVPF